VVALQNKIGKYWDSGKRVVRPEPPAADVLANINDAAIRARSS
jgi:hypothetical protein